MVEHKIRIVESDQQHTESTPSPLPESEARTIFMTRKQEAKENNPTLIFGKDFLDSVARIKIRLSGNDTL